MKRLFDNLQPITELPKRIDTPNGRLYLINKKVYPSITTVLSADKKKAIDKWKARIGEAEAKRITDRATSIGTEIHSLMYEALMEKNHDNFKRKFPEIYENVLPWLKLMEPFQMEAPLYSDYLMVAGTPDFVGYFNNVPYIVDFKTETKEKDIMDIEGYYLQLNAYSVMVYERYGVSVNNLKILMMNVGKMELGRVHEFDLKVTPKMIEKVKKLSKTYIENHFPKFLKVIKE